MRLSKRELEDLMFECGLESTAEITKDYNVGVVIAHQTKPPPNYEGFPWVIHWFPLNESQNERHAGLEIIARP